MPPPTVNNFISNFVSCSSKSSNDVNINYEFEFIPSYYIYEESIIKIEMN